MAETPPSFRFSPLRKWLTRFFLACLLLAGLVFVTTVLALRYWFLPHIESYRESIAQAASRAINQRITVGEIAADWDGLRPHLSLSDVQVFDQSGRLALALNRVSTTLSWLTLTTREVRLHSLEFEQPNLTVRRDPQGVIFVAGAALSQKDTGAGIADWLLKQRHLIVRDATIVWQDEKLAAPQLELKSVTLRLDNGRNRHHFTLQATPPPNLAAPLDVEGDFTGRGLSPDDLARWQGTVSAKFNYADIAAWRTWLPYPIEVRSGTGALSVSLTVKDANVQEAAADLQLSNVRTRLRPDLPEMNLSELRGKLGWKILNRGFELSGTKISLVTEGGFSLKPADFTVRLYPGNDGTPVSGEIEANAFDLQPLVLLADRLPLPQELRQQLVSYSPKGSIYDLALKWSGKLPAPNQYSVKGRFVKLALNAQQQWPGFSGISGTIDGNEQGGQVTVASKNARVEMPKAFENRLRFDTLNVRLGWAVREGHAEFNLTNAIFSNSDLSGNAQGKYIQLSGGPGVVDLSGSLNRVEAASLVRYLPRVVSKNMRDWLTNASVSGTFSEVRLRLKGDLADFPFADETKGLLQVSAKANKVGLEYSSNWPRVENINADLMLNRNRLEVHTTQAETWGVSLAKVDVLIPDVGGDNVLVQAEGETVAAGEKYLRFLERYSTDSKIRSFVAGVNAEGQVKLQLKLEIPLSEKLENKYSGAFQFNNNRISFGPDLPPLEQLAGILRFSDSSLDAQNLNARFLGGPARIDIATRNGDIHISASGQANSEAAAKFTSWAKHLHGSTGWQGSVNITNKLTDAVFESDLRGITSELPAPFDKTADAAVVARFERKIVGPRQERIRANYGNLVSMQFALRKDGERSTIDRGVVVFGAPAGSPEKSGIWVSGVLKILDFDRWNGLLSELGPAGHLDLSGIDVKFDALDALNRRFHDLQVNATLQEGSWKFTVNGKEINGEANWQPQGKGKLIARLSNLRIPEGISEKSGKQVQQKKIMDYPALDIAADDFVLGDKALGKLELQAVPQGNDWRIENLHLSNPDSVFTANGVWLAWSTQPRTDFNIKLDVSDIGNLLARLKLPPGIKGGTANLNGALSWAGSPQSIDYATLSGKLQLKANKGQFLELEPGVAKLLGILSLQSLPKRVTLDFHDIFSKGFAFDNITSSLNLTQGIITTDDFRMRGPLAEINMSGQVNLAGETQDLNMKMSPSYVDSLALAGLLIANPIIGGAAFLVQKALKDPLGRIIYYEYNITGSWSNPVVTKVNVPRPSPEKQLWQNP